MLFFFEEKLKEEKRNEKRNSHSVCLSNFCRNSIAVARWGGLIRWGKCFWKRLQIRNSRTWKNCMLGIQGNQPPAFPLRGFLSPQFSTFRLQLSESWTATFGSNSWMMFGQASFEGHQGGMVDCFLFLFFLVVFWSVEICMISRDRLQQCHVVVTRFSIGSTIWHADDAFTFLCVFLFTLR